MCKPWDGKNYDKKLREGIFFFCGLVQKLNLFFGMDFGMVCFGVLVRLLTAAHVEMVESVRNYARKISLAITF